LKKNVQLKRSRFHLGSIPYFVPNIVTFFVISCVYLCRRTMDYGGFCTKRCGRFTLHVISHVTLFTCFVFSVTSLILYKKVTGVYFESADLPYSACSLNPRICVSMWVFSCIIIGGIPLWSISLIYLYSKPNGLRCYKSK
jgi:hypothetical protein